ncbi:MAG: hypothetical protein Q8Q49_01830 [bacterium]|nr:hypothetical protein [bacterium]
MNRQEALNNPAYAGMDIYCDAVKGEEPVYGYKEVKAQKAKKDRSDWRDNGRENFSTGTNPYYSNGYTPAVPAHTERVVIGYSPIVTVVCHAEEPNPARHDDPRLAGRNEMTPFGK